MVRILPQTETLGISEESIRAYLKPGLILDNEKQFTHAPYIFSTDGEMLDSGLNMKLYVRGLQNPEESGYTVYGPGSVLRHPVTGEVLGFEVVTKAHIMLEKGGDPAQFKILKALGNVEVGMRLFPNFASVLPANYRFQPAHRGIEEGYILSTRDTVAGIGVNNIVIISLGQREGVEEGNYFDIYRVGHHIVDQEAKTVREQKIQLPDKRIGQLVVFQVYEKASLALVLESKEVIQLLDKIKSP